MPPAIPGRTSSQAPYRPSGRMERDNDGDQSEHAMRQSADLRSEFTISRGNNIVREVPYCNVGEMDGNPEAGRNPDA